MLNPRILVAEDDPSAASSLSVVLREQGFDVSTARGGEELLDSLSGRSPDLLLLDVATPGDDGYDLLAKIKSDDRWRDIPVLIVSTQSPEDATERVLGLGAADYIKKPFNARELVARVQAQLRLRAVLQSARKALRSAEAGLIRAREEAESRRKLVDILHEVSGELAPDEIYHLLVRRVARALSLSRCSVILAQAGDKYAVVATAFNDPTLRNYEIDLHLYPEIRSALELGRPVLVEDIQTDPLFAEIRREWQGQETKVLVRSVIALPFTLDTTQAGVFFLRRMIDEPALTTDDVDFADAVIKAAVAAIQRAQVIETAKLENARLEVLAHTDPLTQTLNRRALAARLGAEMERARRYQSVLTLLLLDVDNFKEVNDTRGHVVGDAVLSELAGVLQTAVRAVDVLARYGGEEFIIVLPETVLSGAVTFAERVRTQIEKHAFCADAGEVHITVSIGVASYPGERAETVEELFERVDTALYRGKAAGRNRVAV